MFDLLVLANGTPQRAVAIDDPRQYASSITQLRGLVTRLLAEPSIHGGGTENIVSFDVCSYLSMRLSETGKNG